VIYLVVNAGYIINNAGHITRSSATLLVWVGGHFFALSVDPARGPPAYSSAQSCVIVLARSARSDRLWVLRRPCERSQTESLVSFSGVVTSDQTANKHILYGDTYPWEFCGRHGTRLCAHRRAKDGSYISICCGAVAALWQRLKLDRAQ
jgi:hypothetical protein